MAAGILLPPQRKEIVCARGWKLFLPSYCARCGRVNQSINQVYLMSKTWEPIIENTGKSGEISPGQSNEMANTEELSNHSNGVIKTQEENTKLPQRKRHGYCNERSHLVITRTT